MTLMMLAQSKSNAVDDDDKTIGVELQTVWVDEILQARSSLGQLACRILQHFRSNRASQRNKLDVRIRAGRVPDPTTGPLRIIGKWALDVDTSSLHI